jgi:hypothetical protein
MKARIAGALAVAALCAVSAGAQQARIVNAKLTSRSAAPGLEREFRAAQAGQTAPAWFAYAVPMAGEHHQICCYSDWSDKGPPCGGRCWLEGRDAVSSFTSSDPEQARRVHLERGNLILLFRVEQGKVGKVRTFSEDCELDAGGLPVVWFTDVRPPESVALLNRFVSTTDSALASDSDHRRQAKNALAAIALHADPAADQALERYAATTQPDWLRRDVTFWLGSARGPAGYHLLHRMLRDDPSERVREQAVFGLRVSKEPQAVDAMIATAKNDRSARVRGQALFWLAQKAGQKSAAAITEAIEGDPDTEVKKKAVFALSQLPKDEGVPLLIQVARTNRNPAVRKQAIFWLGQSNDPRALAFFEEVLR